MNGTISRYLDGWRDGEVIDVGREMTRVTMGVAGKVLLDADTFDEADELGAAIQVMMRHMMAQGGTLGLPVRSALGVKLLDLGPPSPRGEARRARAIEWLSMPPRLPTAGSPEPPVPNFMMALRPSKPLLLRVRRA